MKFEMVIIFIISMGIQKSWSAIACHKCEPPNDCRDPDINPPPEADREAFCFADEAVCTTTQRTQDVGDISNTIIERGCSDSVDLTFCVDFRVLYEPSFTNVECEVCKNDALCNNKVFVLPETSTVSSTTITTTPPTTTTMSSSASTTTTISSSPSTTTMSSSPSTTTTISSSPSITTTMSSSPSTTTMSSLPSTITTMSSSPSTTTTESSSPSTTTTMSSSPSTITTVNNSSSISTKTTLSSSSSTTVTNLPPSFRCYSCKSKNSNSDGCNDQFTDSKNSSWKASCSNTISTCYELKYKSGGKMHYERGCLNELTNCTTHAQNVRTEDPSASNINCYTCKKNLCNGVGISFISKAILIYLILIGTIII